MHKDTSIGIVIARGRDMRPLDKCGVAVCDRLVK